MLLDAELRELSRVAAPSHTTALAVSADRIFTGGSSSRVEIFEVRGRALVANGSIELGPELRGVRALAAGSGRLYAIDERGNELAAVDLDSPATRRVQPICARPIELALVGRQLLVDCLTDHTLAIVPLDAQGWPEHEPPRRIVHDGPIWGVSAIERDGELWIALGGVEDRPLDRSIGSFGYIDSFVFLYRVRDEREPELASAVNVSEHGVITPKALRFGEGAEPALDVWGYGGDRSARLVWSKLGEAPRVTTRPAPPGVAFMAAQGARRIGASPLFDAWVIDDGHRMRLVSVASRAERQPLSRVGEALFFTRLMAPANRSDGALSRFTCETCHFEGTVDGRVHHTGRGAVRVSTRSLRGLFENRPYFSRALDPTLAKMVDNEFRAAGAGSGKDPWFSVNRSDFPWLAELGVNDEALSPETLRAALMRFFIDFRHEPNPNAAGRTRFGALERRGAELFLRHCERCHSARLVTDRAESTVAFAEWEAALFERGSPLVWARDEYAKTGVEPYVHERGARIPSLRRLHLERPYLTDGSARTLEDVLAAARFDARRFLHRAAPGDALDAFDASSSAALRAFLELL